MTRPTEGHARGMADTHDAAQLLGCSTSHVYKLVRDGQLAPKDWVGRSPLFYRCDVIALSGDVDGHPERPDLCPLCSRPVGDNPTIWDATRPGRPTPPPGERDDELVELLAFPVRFCSDCDDYEDRLQAVLADRRHPPLNVPSEETPS